MVTGGSTYRARFKYQRKIDKHPLSCICSSCEKNIKVTDYICFVTSMVLFPFQLLKEGELTPGLRYEEYVSRRKKFLELLPEKSLAIFAAGPVKMMTDVVPYTFRQDSDYLYITGCQQAGGLAVLGHECGFCMFMPEANSHVWPGSYDYKFYRP